MKTYLTFMTGGVSFAAELSDVIRIIPAEEAVISPAPNFPPYMPGTAAIDGEATPVIDTAIRFGLGERVTGKRACCILAALDHSSGLAERYERCAALVDEVSGIVNSESLSPAPALNSESFAKYIKGTFIADGVTYYAVSPELLVGD